MQSKNLEKIKHVIYISRPTHFDHIVLDDILKTSRSNNPKNGITGNLIFHSDLFLQILEGPPEAINNLYDRILSDSRHGDIVKLRDSEFPRRLYASWAMKNDGYQSWMLSRDEINQFNAEEALSLFDKLARETDQFLP
jgi:hypothetical protein